MALYAGGKWGGGGEVGGELINGVIIKLRTAWAYKQGGGRGLYTGFYDISVTRKWFLHVQFHPGMKSFLSMVKCYRFLLLFHN